MKSLGLLPTLVLLSLITCSSGACAQDSRPPTPGPQADAVDVPAVQSARGQLRVRVWRYRGFSYIMASGHAAGPLYLCCSQYPQVFRNGMLEGAHLVVPVEGDFEYVWKVDPQFAGGLFEVDLWAQKVERASCKLPDDPWCELCGFHLEDSAASASGSLDTP
jgi:hypothetical protein